MKLGIIGLSQSGRSTIFEALTGARGLDRIHRASRTGERIGTVKVADGRVDLLDQIFKPKKTTYARVEYLLPSDIVPGGQAGSETAIWGQIRSCDALIQVIRHFPAPGGMAPTPADDLRHLEEEMILNDLAVAEKRMDRIALDKKRGKRPDESEYALIRSCREVLEEGRPIRAVPELATAPELRGFTFLSAKPRLIIVNNDDEDESFPEWGSDTPGSDAMMVRGRLEMEIASLSPEEAEEFKQAYHIDESVLDRVIGLSYDILDLISFFTVLNDEVRAWAIKRGTPSLEAAGTVHSDMQKGFIRAEVLPFEDLKAYGSFQEAKKIGKVSLEGKEYIVRDGDIINFRFNL